MRIGPSGRLAQDHAQAGYGPAEGVLGRGAVAHDQGRPVVPSRHAISVSTRAWVPGSYQP